MKTVYAVMHQVCYEGAEVLVLCTTQEQANEVRDDLLRVVEGVSYEYVNDSNIRLYYPEPQKFTETVVHFKYKPEDLFIEPTNLLEEGEAFFIGAK